MVFRQFVQIQNAEYKKLSLNPVTIGGLLCIEPSMVRKKKAELRLYISPNLDRLLKTLSGLSDQTVSSIVEDTLKECLPDRYRTLMDAHNLEKILEDEE